MRLVNVLSAAIVSSIALSSAPALAATCNNPGGFDAFLAEFKKEAAGKGLSAKTPANLNNVTLGPSVLVADKRQACSN